VAQDAGDKMHVITMGSVAIEVPDHTQPKCHVTSPSDETAKGHVTTPSDETDQNDEMHEAGELLGLHKRFGLTRTPRRLCTRMG